jgi:hypothetical protein
MTTDEIRERVKDAIRRWAQQLEAKVLLDDRLSKFQSADLDGLRVELNRAFRGESGFPITAKQWEKLTLKTVRNVRDAVTKLLGGV